MDEQEIIRKTKRLIQRWDNLRILGSRGEWSGSARQGFMFNPKRGGSGRAIAPPPVDCCNREVTEISTMTLSGTMTVSCGGLCEGGCSLSRTWTRIPHTTPFNDVDDQFWFYTENPPGSCNNMFAVFNQPDFLHPTAVCQDETIGLAGSVDLNEFIIFPAVGDEFDIVMQFFVAASRTGGTCFDAPCNGHSVEETIHVTACSVAPLLGDHSFTKHCDTAGGCSIDIEGHVIFA